MSQTIAVLLGRFLPALIVGAGAGWIYPPAGLIAFGGMIWLETRMRRVKG